LVIIDEGRLLAEFPVSELPERTFVRSYTIRTRSQQESMALSSALQERGLQVENRGINLEVTLGAKADLGVLEELQLQYSPLRSLLEQYFMDVTQG
ncbi:MAG: hypothetical protein D6698_15270, partial [Gammaproteobacteria bacterium]